MKILHLSIVMCVVGLSYYLLTRYYKKPIQINQVINEFEQDPFDSLNDDFKRFHTENDSWDYEWGL